MLTSEYIRRSIPEFGLGLICGDIRQGKSALGYALLQDLSIDRELNCYVMGVPAVKRHLFPDWILFSDILDDIPPGSVVLCDEAYIALHSRDSMSIENKMADLLAGLVGQRELVAIYITQQTRKLDIGIVSCANFIFWKRPSLLQQHFERPQIRKMSQLARKSFEGLSPEKCRNGCYVISGDFEGFVPEANELPDWWSDDISKAFKGVSLTRTGDEVLDLPLLDSLDIEIKETDDIDYLIGLVDTLKRRLARRFVITHDHRCNVLYKNFEEVLGYLERERLRLKNGDT